MKFIVLSTISIEKLQWFSILSEFFLNKTFLFFDIVFIM